MIPISFQDIKIPAKTGDPSHRRFYVPRPITWNKEKLSEYSKNYYKENFTKYQEIITCECGFPLTKGGKLETQTQKHIQLMNEKILKSKWSYNNEQYFRLFIFKEKLGIGNKATFITKD